jgi:hypothetical protein
MKSVNSGSKPTGVGVIKKVFVNAVPAPFGINDMLDDAISECEDEVFIKQEILDGLKSLKQVFKNITPGSKEEKALLALLAGSDGTFTF